MPIRTRVTAMVAAWALAPALCAAAIAPPGSAQGTIPLASGAVRVGDADRQHALGSGTLWQSFRAAHGNWVAEWNERTGTPHRALGPSIPLTGFTPDSAGVDAALRGFVVANRALLGGPVTLEPSAIRHHGRAWYASYRERVAGAPVLFADWEFRVSDAGRLMMFGADAIRPAAAPVPRAFIAPAAARVAATQGIAFDPGTDRARVLPERYWLPGRDPADDRLVSLVAIETARPPFTSWLAFVDAASGALVARIERSHSAVAGRITALVHAGLPTDSMSRVPLPDLIVRAGEDSAVTDTAGRYTLSVGGPAHLRFGLQGRFASVARVDILPVGTIDARDSVDAVDPSTVDVAWGEDGLSHDAERDAYVSGELAHAHLKAVDPAFTGLDTPIPLFVNNPYNHCNAINTGVAIYFFNAGDGCVNFATMRDVLFHEYGHSVNDAIYVASGDELGMLNGALHEGMADVNAALDGDDPVIGKGTFGPGTFLRDLRQWHQWPESIVGEIHTDGQIVGGAFWGLRRSIGLDAAARLAIQARYGHPDDPDDGVAFHEMFYEVLVADDDDGDFSTGTPHEGAILSAFGGHGIGFNFGLTIAHAPPPDPVSGDAIPISATIRYAGLPLTSLDTSSPTLHFAVNRGEYQTLPMTGAGSDTFVAWLTLPAGSVVSYYFSARELYGSEVQWPIGAPSARVFRLVIGPATTVKLWDMETDPGWTVGAPNDHATGGVWVRTDPTGTFAFDPSTPVPVQPGDDHTPGGTMCWVTGNADTLFPPNYKDVDGGQTTLTSTVFDPLVGGIEHPLIEYWRWYSNSLGYDGDLWRVDLSGDGGRTWVPVEETRVSAPSWERILFRIEDVLPPTHTMRLRFVANDANAPSIVEAAVDDVRLMGFAPGFASASATFGAPQPNPFRTETHIGFALWTPGPVRLVLYDVLGRRVRRLADGTFAAGAHTIAWDGRDDAGRTVPGGIYFARLEAAGTRIVRRILRAP